MEFGQGRFRPQQRNAARTTSAPCWSQIDETLRFQRASHLGGVVDEALHDEGVLGPHVRMGPNAADPVVPNLA